MNKIIHGIGYFFWIVKEIIVSGFNTAFTAFKPDAGLKPIVIHYPLRLTTDWELFWFSTSITATPSTLAMGFREPAAPGEPHILLVQSAFGDDAHDVIAGLIDMEEHVSPAVKSTPLDVADVAWEPYVPEGDLT